MELKNLVTQTNKELVANIEYDLDEFDEGIVFSIRYIDRNEFQKLNNDCTKIVFNKKTHRPESSLDDDKLRTRFVDQCVTGWSGMTFKKLSNLVPIDPEAFKEAVAEGKKAKQKITIDSEVAYDKNLLTVVMQKAFGLENWLTTQATNLSNFQSDLGELEDGLKKSQASPDGNSQGE